MYKLCSSYIFKIPTKHKLYYQRQRWESIPYFAKIYKYITLYSLKPAKYKIHVVPTLNVICGWLLRYSLTSRVMYSCSLQCHSSHKLLQRKQFPKLLDLTFFLFHHYDCTSTLLLFCGLELHRVGLSLTLVYI